MLRHFFTVGARGERAAFRYLRNRYYFIWEQNWRSSSGEVDLIASRGRILVFCEVKTRRAEVAPKFSPAAAVTIEKQAQLRKLADEFLADNRRRLKRHRIMRIQFDVFAVVYRRWWLPMRVRHLPDAFQ